METIDDKLDALQQQLNGAAAFIALSTCFVAVKLLALLLRKNLRSAWGWDDAFILASLGAFVPMCVFAIVNAKAYMSFYTTQEEAAISVHLITIYKTAYAISILYMLASTFPKLSLCVLYLRIFDVSPWARRIMFGMILLLTLNAIAWLAPTIFVCSPISAYWNPDGHDGRCLNYNVFGTWKPLPNIITDIVMLILPMPILWRTNISRPKKIGLIATFAAASAGIVGASLRLGFYVRRTYVDRPGTAQTTRSIAVNVIVTYIECGMYLIAACLPSLRIIFVQLQKVLSTTVTSLLQRRRAYPSHEGVGANSDESLAKASDKMPVDKVFVKLTGIGNLDTLAKEGEEIGISKAGSGLWSRKSMLNFDAATDNRPEQVHVLAPVCHICQCVKVPADEAERRQSLRPIIE